MDAGRGAKPGVDGQAPTQAPRAPRGGKPATQPAPEPDPAPMIFAQLEWALAHRRGAGGGYDTLASGRPGEAWRALLGPRLLAAHMNEIGDLKPGHLEAILRDVESNGLLCTLGTGDSTGELAAFGLASRHSDVFSRHALSVDDDAETRLHRACVNLQIRLRLAMPAPH